MTTVMDERTELTRAFARLANGHKRDAVINASGNMVLNAIRQNHATFEEAEKELDYLVERMRAALKENHYTDTGSRRVTNIVVPYLGNLVESFPTK